MWYSRITASTDFDTDLGFHELQRSRRIPFLAAPSVELDSGVYSNDLAAAILTPVWMKVIGGSAHNCSQLKQDEEVDSWTISMNNLGWLVLNACCVARPVPKPRRPLLVDRQLRLRW